jgi:prepilin-type N-terminal cleavage/methylation domain-containing protein
MRHNAFTLIELMVVLVIIVLISVVTLPVIMPALAHRQVSEGVRLLQGALVGARDDALRNNRVGGIRLLPDPAFPAVRLPNGQLDPWQPLASNGFIPLAAAPDYSEGLAAIWTGQLPPAVAAIPYPGPSTPQITNPTYSQTSVLMLYECVLDPAGLPNSPTSWWWNIRMGDQVQLNNVGPLYTVVGPMVQWNPELFINAGPPGTISPFQSSGIAPEFLLLVDGVVDPSTGYTDPGWDGVDNDGINGIDDIGEWIGRPESWQGSVLSQSNQQLQYTIKRRPCPAASGRQIFLPSNVVIDLTTSLSTWPTAHERSRLPVNIYTGYVDIVINPDGSLVPTTIYSSPTSFTMDSSFLHFWIGERADVVTPVPNLINPNAPPYLPLPTAVAPNYNPPPAPPFIPIFNGTMLRGECRILTLFARTGRTAHTDEPKFDLAANIHPGTYNPILPFVPAQQGVNDQ